MDSISIWYFLNELENVEQNRQEQSSESVGKCSWDLAEFTRTLVLIQPILNYDEIEAYWIIEE